MQPEQFEKYQIFTEQTINNLSQQVMELEKKLDMFSNLLAISKYINQYIKDPNLFSLINDMLIGVFGAKYSSIYIKLNDGYIEATKTIAYSFSEAEINQILEQKEEEFIINSDSPIYSNHSEVDKIYSCVGIPVAVDNRLVGYILIQHTDKDYFTKDHAKFLSSIGNHIGVAIENNLLYKQIKESAYRDGLTEIFNKRYFFETLKANLNLAEQNYSIAMVDLDNFKSINDNYGHPYGDIVLKSVANIIKNATRSHDIVARYGGDEIIIYFNGFTDREKVLQRVELMRKEIEQTVYVIEGVTASATVSFGVYRKYNEDLSLDEVIKKADDYLYESKKRGKNKVTIS